MNHKTMHCEFYLINKYACAFGLLSIDKQTLAENIVR